MLFAGDCFALYVLFAYCSLLVTWFVGGQIGCYYLRVGFRGFPGRLRSGQLGGGVLWFICFGLLLKVLLM